MARVRVDHKDEADQKRAYNYIGNEGQSSDVGDSASAVYLDPIDSCLAEKSVLQVWQDLLLFDSRLPRRFTKVDAAYRYTCKSKDCNSQRCSVPHLAISVRVMGREDDEIGIILQTDEGYIRNILPQVPNGRYSYRTWRNSRWHVLKRMFMCLCIYHLDRDMESVRRLVARPLHVYMLGGVMGRMIDLQKPYVLARATYEAVGGSCNDVTGDNLGVRSKRSYNTEESDLDTLLDLCDADEEEWEPLLKTPSSSGHYERSLHETKTFL